MSRGEATTDAAATLVRRLDSRILALLTAGMFLALFDRVNLSYAALQMNADLGFGPEVFGAAVAALFAGYALFEIPSAYALVRVGARHWLPFILVTWGTASACLALVRDPVSLYALRFVVGVAEAGYPASCAFVIAGWYPADHRMRAMSKWMSGSLVALVLAAPLSTLIMSADWFGVRGWQWLFVLGGLPAILLGALIFRNLGGGPEGAAWLPEASRALLRREHAAADPASHAHGFAAAFRSPGVWIYTLCFILLNLAGQILIFWLPQIVRDEWPALSILEIGLIGALPFVFAIAANLAVRRSTERLGDSRWHVVSMLAATALLLVVAIHSPDPVMRLAVLGVGIGCFYVCLIILLSLPLITLAGAAVASAIALINTGGQLGAAAGPYAMGWFKARSGAYDSGLYLSAAAFLLCALLPLLFAHLFPPPVQRQADGTRRDATAALGEHP